MWHTANFIAMILKILTLVHHILKIMMFVHLFFSIFRFGVLVSIVLVTRWWQTLLCRVWFWVRNFSFGVNMMSLNINIKWECNLYVLISSSETTHLSLSHHIIMVIHYLRCALHRSISWIISSNDPRRGSFISDIMSINCLRR